MFGMSTKTTPRAAPVRYSPELDAEIVSRMSEGETLRSICRSEHMPNWVTVYAWMDRDPEFQQRIERARLLGADCIADECIEIANTPLEGVRIEEGGRDGMKRVKEDMLGHRKLQIDTRLRLLSKWHPKKYGEKQSIEVTDTNVADAIAAARNRTSGGSDS